jgi:hypothetical protein
MMARRAEWYANNKLESKAVWLQCKLNNETQTRRAHVRKLMIVPSASPWSRLTDASAAIQEYKLVIERAALWESDSLKTPSYTQADNEMSCLGGVLDFNSSQAIGDADARAVLFSWAPVVGGGTIERVWWGWISTNRFPNSDGLYPTWALKNGTMGTDTTTAVDATAKAGTRTTTTFATATLTARVTITVEQAITGQAAPVDAMGQIGTFIVLLRAKLSAAGTVRVRMADGLSAAGATFSPRARVPITSTSWQFYELGQVALPATGTAPYNTSYIDGSAIRIDAERTSGTCDLYMDTLIMIPAAESYGYFDGAAISGAGNVTIVNYHDRPYFGESFNNAGDNTTVIPRIFAGTMPLGTCKLVVAGQESGSSALTNEVAAGLQFIRTRWRDFRGAS